MSKKKLIIRCCIAVCCLTALVFTILFATGIFDPYNKYDSLKISSAAMKKLEECCPPSKTQTIIKAHCLNLFQSLTKYSSFIDALDAYTNARPTTNEMDCYHYYYYDSLTNTAFFLSFRNSKLSIAKKDDCYLSTGNFNTKWYSEACYIILNAKKLLQTFLPNIPTISVKHCFLLYAASPIIYLVTNSEDYILYREIKDTSEDQTSVAYIDYLISAKLFREKLLNDENNPFLTNNPSSIFVSYHPCMDWAKEYIVEIPTEF